MRDRTLSSWVLRNFPDSSPKEIVRAAARTESVDLEEYQRATWLWQRRPSDVSILVHFLILAVGALIHIPLILANDLMHFCDLPRDLYRLDDRLRGPISLAGVAIPSLETGLSPFSRAPGKRGRFSELTLWPTA